MTHEDTRQTIERLLREQLSPSFLVVVDDSHSHAGHLAALNSPEKGHYIVEIASDAFIGISKVKSHQLVYAAIGNLLNTHIHALSLNIKNNVG